MGLEEASEISVRSAQPSLVLWRPDHGEREVVVTAQSAFTEQPPCADTVLGSGDGAALTDAEV